MSDETEEHVLNRSPSREKKVKAKVVKKKGAFDLSTQGIAKKGMKRQSSDRFGYQLPSMYNISNESRGRARRSRIPKSAEEIVPHEEPAAVTSPSSQEALPEQKAQSPPTTAWDQSATKRKSLALVNSQAKLSPKSRSLAFTHLSDYIRTNQSAPSLFSDKMYPSSSNSSVHTVPPHGNREPIFTESNVIIARDDDLEERDSQPSTDWLAVQENNKKPSCPFSSVWDSPHDASFQEHERNFIKDSLSISSSKASVQRNAADEAQESSPRSTTTTNNNNKRKRWSLIIFVLIIVGGFVGVILMLTVNRTDTDTGNAPSTLVVTPPPSTAPSITSSPTSVFDAFASTLATNITRSTPQSKESLKDQSSHQYQAVMWVADLLYNEGQTLTDDQILQKFALGTFYYATNGNGWSNNSGWLDKTLSECHWNGLSCSTVDSDAVTGLNFAAPNNFVGTLPNELSLLSQLTFLSLFKSPSLTGTLGSILSGEGPASVLETIRVEWCRMVGSIPTTIGKLTTLVNFIVDGNELTGTLPNELIFLTKLEVLVVNDNKFSGTLPSELGQLTQLTNLLLYSNQFTGSIPSRLPPSLKKLNFDFNRFTGGLEFLQGLTSLSIVSGSNNILSKTLPTFLGQLSALESLYLDGNQISGTVLAEFGNINGFKQLKLGSNLLTGSVPFDALTNLQTLSLSNNQLLGSLPTILGIMTNLLYLDLSQTQLLGTLSSILGLMANLKYLDLSKNQIQGSIPTELGTMTKLYNLNMASNLLGGSIPTELSNLFNFIGYILEGSVLLDVSSNELVGPIPTELVMAMGIQELILEHNNLTGSLPEELRNQTKLSVLRVGNNRLTGTLPSTFGLAINLTVLGLENNQFQGTIPLDYYNLDALYDFRTQGNLLTGTAPELFCLSTALGRPTIGTQYLVECPMMCSCCNECVTSV